MTKLSSKCGVFAFLFGFILVLKYYKNNAFEYLQIHCKKNAQICTFFFFGGGGGGGGGVRWVGGGGRGRWREGRHTGTQTSLAGLPASQKCAHGFATSMIGPKKTLSTPSPFPPQSFFRNSLVQPCSNNNNTKKKKKKKK